LRLYNKLHISLMPVGDANMVPLELNVKGMSCQHCANTIKNALLETDPKAAVTVEIKKGLVQIESRIITREQAARAIEEAGYTVSPAQI
jgi:copper chaperone